MPTVRGCGASSGGWPASLLIACVIPAAVFYGVLVVADVWTAMVVALVWSYGAIAFRALTGRRTSGLLILTAAVLTGRTVVAAVADSTFLYFLQPIISDGVVATASCCRWPPPGRSWPAWPATSTRWTTSCSMRPRIQRLFFHLTARGRRSAWARR